MDEQVQELSKAEMERVQGGFAHESDKHSNRAGFTSFLAQCVTDGGQSGSLFRTRIMMDGEETS